MIATTATFLFGGLKWLRKAAQALWGLVTDYPWQAALIVALCLAGWLWRGKERAEANYADLERAFVAYQDDVKRASDAAIALATAEKERKEREYAEAAKQADSAYDELAARYRAGLMRKAAADPGGPRRTDMPSGTGTPGISEVAAGDPGFHISTADAMKTADVSAYAMACFQWAQKVDAVAD